MKFERLAFLGTLASGLVHEIKNQLLKEDLEYIPRDDKIHKKIDLIQRETIRLEEILNDFLRYAKRKEPQLCMEDLHNILNEIVTFVAPESRQSNVEIRKEFDTQVPGILLDRNLIKQALLNVIINAEQAMPNGGVLIVKTFQENNNIRIDIIDTGVGIKPENIEKIFDIYYSTKSGGTGLGLATAKQIIEDHNGNITVKSEECRGSNFSIILPLGTTPY